MKLPQIFRLHNCISLLTEKTNPIERKRSETKNLIKFSQIELYMKGRTKRFLLKKSFQVNIPPSFLLVLQKLETLNFSPKLKPQLTFSNPRQALSLFCVSLGPTGQN
jgi:hypothetical protein